MKTLPIQNKKLIIYLKSIIEKKEFKKEKL